MVLLVPVTPEVPKNAIPRWWPALGMALFLALIYLWAKPVLDADQAYVTNMSQFLYFDMEGKTQLSGNGQKYLSHRPLMDIAPSKGDWNWSRLLVANFIHGSSSHLILNMLGIFAGVRICTTFLAFSSILFIFLLGGSFGLLSSILWSSEISDFIPHVGASGGIFALMGTYYIYNFRFRTRYFFWFPSHRGMISLKTNWFFFFDVILLELVLTAAQLLPQRIDPVDHIAHVTGFMTGLLIAVSYRFLCRWEPWLQTREEFKLWCKLRRSHAVETLQSDVRILCDLLAINPYNDLAKIRLCTLLSKQAPKTTALELSEAFAYLKPTFIRLQASFACLPVIAILEKEKDLPKEWLARIPYDCVIRIARALASAPQAQLLIYRFLSQYKAIHEKTRGRDKKLDLLLGKMEGLLGIKSA